MWDVVGMCSVGRKRGHWGLFPSLQGGVRHAGWLTWDLGSRICSLGSGIFLVVQRVLI
jgi:hypothetical protein